MREDRMLCRYMGAMRPVVCSQPPKSSPRSGSGPGSPGLLACLRERIRYLHHSLRTEQACVYWARAFVRYHGMRHPRDLGPVEVERFLVRPARERRASVSPDQQALCAPPQPPPIPARTTADRSHRFGTTSDE